ARQAAVRAAAAADRQGRLGARRVALRRGRTAPARLLRGPRPRRARLVRQPHRGRRRQPRILPACPDQEHLMLPISLEFFPPKTPEGSDKLRAARQALYALKPEFCSVTYGAGGSTHAGTFTTVGEILAEGVEAASHFSCIGATRAKVRDQLAQLRAMGVKRLVALRGDLPSGYGMGGEFQFASELVEFIRSECGSEFRIEVACYPETHPQAKSPQADLQAFATKVKAG